MKKPLLITVFLLCVFAALGFIANQYYLQHQQKKNDGYFWDIGINKKIETASSENEFWDLPDNSQGNK